MGILEQLYQMPYAATWLPGAMCVIIIGVLYLLIRPVAAPALVGTEAETTPQVSSNPTAAAAKPKDQRAGWRRNGNPVEVYVAEIDKKEDPTVGSVLDRSVGGMRLALFSEVAVGTVLTIRPVRADEMVPWIELEVRSCKPSKEMPGQFEVGCQYVKVPP